MTEPFPSRSESYSAMTLGIGMHQKLLAVSSVCLLALAAGCTIQIQSSPPGTVSGLFEPTNGGLSNTATRLLPGTVVFTSSSGKSRSLEIARNGSIDIRLAPGTWTATGQSPLVKSGSREVTCHALTPVVVHSGRTTHANVICELR
jgi:hypothetical protein